MADKKFDLASQLPDIDSVYARRIAMLAGGITLTGLAAVGLKQFKDKRSSANPESAEHKRTFNFLRENGLNTVQRLHLDVMMGYIAAKKSFNLYKLEVFMKQHLDMTVQDAPAFSPMTMYELLPALIDTDYLRLNENAGDVEPWEFNDNEGDISFMLHPARRELYPDIHMAHEAASRVA